MIASLSLLPLLAVFAGSAAVLVITAIRATDLADILADRTRMGEALVGAVLLGAATSLAGTIVSINAAASGDASFAFSNAVGGIAAQTLFLALADLTYRKANLEHAAAEPANLFQSVLLILLLCLPLAAIAGPNISFWGIHPASPLLVMVYLGGLHLTARLRDEPMWQPVQTPETRTDTPEDSSEPHRSALKPALGFAALVAVLGLCGWVISQVGGTLIARFGMGSTLVGALVTAVVTSMPELVTTLAATRRGALQLALGGIIGGNTFDTLFLVFADTAYREGSLYHAVGTQDLYWLVTGQMMTAVLLAGLILRQRHGPAQIGLESLLLILIYGGAVALAVVGG
ncbi:cation:H+ antiporter [Mameliella alba]|uniref:sodium:calcium antiporter n=1 Tax=Mameliella alba TaxID=561184 RepID=UPI0008916A23|nr:cation transporter [Mameliella alba]OWV47832.1 cation transporter [Mameliella alba]PTR39781.1 cation:H+ antiporter [Mameliella alba]GGF61572.1 cation transporter [Mameliella alba]SDD12480.1 cation:H+ antiporter [Mameliella alba]